MSQATASSCRRHYDIAGGFSFRLTINEEFRLRQSVMQLKTG